jgi:MFS family permease
MFMSASILGPVLGGLLTDHLHWSLIFWINLPLGAIALIMTERALRRLPLNHRPHQLDVIGAALMVSAALTLMMALSWGGAQYGWASSRILMLLGCSAVLWVLFALRLLTAREPFIPIAILHGGVTTTITVAAFFSIGTVIGITIYTPLYCQNVLGASASLSGLALIAYMGGATVGSLVSTRIVVRMKHYMRIPMAGLVLAIIVLAVLVANPAAYTLTEVVILIALLGLGLGPMYPVSTIVMQNTVKPHQLGTATGTLNFFRTLGGALIVAIFGAIVLGGVGDGSQALTIDKLAVGHGNLAPAFHWVFIAAAVCLGISLLCVAAVEERPLHGPHRAVAETA